MKSGVTQLEDISLKELPHTTCVTKFLISTGIIESTQSPEVFDKEYATHLTRGFPDNGGPTYVLPDLGLSRTLSVHYTHNF